MAKKPAAAANRKDSEDPASAGRIKQIRMVAGIIRRTNPRALPPVSYTHLTLPTIYSV